MKVNKRHFLDNEKLKCITIRPMLQEMLLRDIQYFGQKVFNTKQKLRFIKINENLYP